MDWTGPQQTLPDGQGIVTVLMRWSNKHGECYGCGLPAAFWIPNRNVDHLSPTAPHASEKRCAVCAANEAAEGLLIRRIDSEF